MPTLPNEQSSSMTSADKITLRLIPDDQHKQPADVNKNIREENPEKMPQNTEHRNISSQTTMGESSSLASVTPPAEENGLDRQFFPRKPVTTSDSPQTDSHSSELPNFSKNWRIVYLLLLFSLNMCCYMDRSTIMAVQNNVKKAFCLTDKQAGLLQTSFTFPYMFASLAAGFMGDRFNRKWIIVGGTVIWISSVILGSLVTTADNFLLAQTLVSKDQQVWFFAAQREKIQSQFYLLLLSRAGVGIGDACLVTIGPTIIDDLFFSGSSQLKALTLFNMAIPIGSGLGYLFAKQGMTLANHLQWEGLGFDQINIWTYGVRSTLVFSIPILVVIILLMPKIPLGWSRSYKYLISHASTDSPSESHISESSNLVKQNNQNSSQIDNREIPSIKESLSDFMRIKTFVSSTLGSTCCWFIVGAAQMWLLQMFIRKAEEESLSARQSRQFGLVECDVCGAPMPNETQQSIDQTKKLEDIIGSTSAIYGGIVLMSGIVGPLVAVTMANRWKAVKNSIECDLCAWSQLLGGVFLGITLLTVDWSNFVAWVMVSLAITTCSFNFALGVKIIMSIVRSTQKNFALGSYNLFGHLLGDGISGYLLGFVSDKLASKTRKKAQFQCMNSDSQSEISGGTFETIKMSMYILCVVSVVGWVLFKYAGRHYTKDEKRAGNGDYRTNRTESDVTVSKSEKI